MYIKDLKLKVDIIKSKLLEMRDIAFIHPDSFKEDELTGNAPLEGTDQMSEVSPEKNTLLHNTWLEVQKIIPPGLSINANLVRHLSFNQAHDWFDISNRDIPQMLDELDKYSTRLSLIEYLQSLHPQISRVSSIVLNGDIDAALKTVYASLEAYIRSFLKLKPSTSTVPAIGKAFKEGVLNAPVSEHNEPARNFLQGVIGYYRSTLLHTNLPPNSNIESTLSLFGLAHEAFTLFELCSIEILAEKK